MEEIKRKLEKRQNQLQRLKKEKEKALMNVPEGALRVCCHGNRVQYYRRNDAKDFNGVYLKEKDLPVARKLAQKDYDKKVLQAAQKELNAIEKYLACYPKIQAEQVYEMLHPERRKLINPIQMSEEDFVKQWQSVKYKGKGFKENIPELYTVNEERVRSKSELIIADLLNKEGIPYRYEYPILLSGLGTVYPDFTVLNVKRRKELYWEHLGMMDEPEYVEKALQKITMYEENGIFPGENLILTYETRLNPISSKMINLMISQYLK